MKKFIAAALLSLWASVASAGVTCTLPFNLLNNTIADATQVMANYNALVTCFTQAAASGVNSDITALTAISTPLTPAQGGSSVYIAGVSTGSANAQVVATPVPAGFSLTTNKRITFIAGFTNTGPATINVNGLGATNIYRQSPIGAIQLRGGELAAGNSVEAVYDGLQFVIYNPQAAINTGPLTALASATTTDIGLVPSHNVLITGGTTITGFGSSAVSTFPLYKLVFQGALTLVYNGTTNILIGGANIPTASGDSAWMMYLGGGAWLMTDYTRASGTAVINPTPMSGAQGLLIKNNAATPSSIMDITTDQAVMINPAGNVPIYATAVSLSINCSVNGANGLDAGGLSTNTWYNLFLISNGTTTSGLASTSATNPTMPAGYTYLVRVGAVSTDGSANFYRTRQQGARAVYQVVTASNTTAPRVMATGSASAWTAIATGAYVPPTATQIKGITSSISMGNNTTTSMAPNNNYATTSTGNTAATPWSITNSTGAANGLSANMVFEFNLESTNIYYGSNAGGSTAISAVGWTDKVNAN